MAHRAITSSASVVLCLLAFVFHLEPTVAVAADVLTQHNDSARTGVNPDEKLLNRAGVRSATFGRLWTLYADGQVVAQPLYVSGLAIDTAGNPNAPRVQGTFNAVIVATMHNTVYAYEADNAQARPAGPHRAALGHLARPSRGAATTTSTCSPPTTPNGAS